MGDPISLTLLAISTATGIASATSQRDASLAQQRQQEVNVAQSRRAANRETVLRRAQAAQSAQAAGASTGSGSYGGMGAQASNNAQGLGFSTQMGAISSQIATAQTNANTYAGIANLTGSWANSISGSKQGVADPDLLPPKPKPKKKE
tara:strand:- start:57 stop:500 length:444 start_codon:yes stop_codon:yes gene_type:complete